MEVWPPAHNDRNGDLNKGGSERLELCESYPLRICIKFFRPRHYRGQSCDIEIHHKTIYTLIEPSLSPSLLTCPNSHLEAKNPNVNESDRGLYIAHLQFPV